MIRSLQGRVIAALVILVCVVAVLQNKSGERSFLPSLPLPQRSSNRKYPTLRERFALSEKSWLKSVELRKQMAVAHPDNPQIPLFPAQSLDEFGKYPYTLWDFFPPTWTCPHDIQRVGRLGDGGKWVCGMSIYESIPAPSAAPSRWGLSSPAQQGVVMYSFGINYESSFEAEMLERVPSLQIWGYDFSVDGWGPQIAEAHRPRTFFKKVGLGQVDQPTRNPPFYTLQALMAQNNHTYIDILKIDIEGNEYTAFDTVMNHFAREWRHKGAEGDAVLPIGQVMIEIHVGADQPSVSFQRFRKWWERLEGMGMRPTWMEVNLMAVTLAKGKSDPRCTEYVWVNARDERSVLWRG
ncbi:hypothetical protein BU26DRAFT_524601 [Trematosphaeria pertusa]|uniref:Methyltransferase domain-containing protein n=1 Tax=Trematosphaeria pertusa TaxID=390896 RepID=A0A6A6HUU8_9PLEO|nr:uncharacterized protein BU26DRAFT_524601 [Trematosphaeria pertusa]KAF2241954.1 hypothetical protein BU26DRAFT_524601 [Trematosphaeria pertusa]